MALTSGGLGEFRGCEIVGNKGAGVNISDGGSPFFLSCTLREGEREGMLFEDGGKGRVERCEVTNNTGSNISIASGSDSLIVECKLDVDN